MSKREEFFKEAFPAWVHCIDQRDLKILWNSYVFPWVEKRIPYFREWGENRDDDIAYIKGQVSNWSEKDRERLKDAI